jgi:hypothetical protein
MSATAFVLLALGAACGLLGLALCVIVAPRRGDGWGYFGLTLVPIGLWLCYVFLAA